MYNPTLLDHIRNVQKAVKKTPTTANVAVIASTDVAIFDNFILNDSIVVNANGAPSAGPYVYGANYLGQINLDFPIRDYRMNTASATDSGSQTQNGTINGGVTTGQSGLITSMTDASMLFNGSTGYISLPTTGLPSGANAWTVEAWFKAPVVSGFMTLLCLGGNGVANAGMELAISSSTVAVSDSLTPKVTSATISANTIYYAAATYNGSTITIYVYNSSGLFATNSGAYAYSLNYSGGIAQIGDDWYGDFFSGYLQGVGIYNTALSSGEIALHATTGFSTAIGAKYGFSSYS